SLVFPGLARTVSGAALLDRLTLLRRPSRPAHHDALLIDELTRVRVPVLVALHATARITLDVERARVALLLVRTVLFPTLAPPSQHGSMLPVRRYTKPLPGAFV